MQLDPEFAIVKEAEDLVAKLCDMYPEKLAHIEANTVGCAMVTNKPRPEGQAFDCTMVGIKPPVTLYTSKKYIIWFFQNVWDNFTPAQKSAMLMAKLLRTDEEAPGKVLPEDLKDVKCLVKTLGIDYMRNPSLIDLAAVKQIL